MTSAFTLNGKSMELEIEPRETLAEVLRALPVDRREDLVRGPGVWQLHGSGGRASGERVHLPGL